MLRRRILASSMASVMALTSVVGVAFAADENAKVTTKEGLQEYIDSFDSFREDDIYEYGDVQADDFLDAIGYAENVANDPDSTAKDYAAAYTMLEQVRGKMRSYTKEDLEGLIKDYKSIYDENNILNEELNDNRYDVDTYTEFYDAYEEALDYVDSGDGRLISNAYAALEKAKKGLKELDKVTKSEFRSVIKQYEAIIKQEKNYEWWRRGTCSKKPSTSVKGTTADTSIDDITDNPYVTFGDILNITYGDSQGDNDGHVSGVAALTEGMYINRGSDDTVNEFVHNQHDRFDAIKTSNVTTDETIMAAYKSAKDAVAVFAGWTKDNTDSASVTSVKKLMSKYHDQLVLNFNSDLVKEVLNSKALNGGSAAGSADPTNYTMDQFKAPDKGSLAVHDTTKWVDQGFKNTATDAKNTWGADGLVEQKVAKNASILKYVPITYTEIQVVTEAANVKYAETTSVKDDIEDLNVTNLGFAYELAEKYLEQAAKPSKDQNFADIKFNSTHTLASDLDTLGTVVDAKGSAAEWKLVNRALQYCIDDFFTTPSTWKHTRKDVEDYAEKAYKLADETGDASIFNDAYMNLVSARKAALEWVKEAKADKLYKEGEAVKAYDAEYWVDDGKNKNYIDGGSEVNTASDETKIVATADDAWDFIDEYYTDLEDMYKAYKYSYGQIKDKVGEVRAAIVAGTVDETDALKTALETCAYDLSVVEASDTSVDNEAFDGEREMQIHNRLKTAKWFSKDPSEFEKNLKASYEALIEAYDKAVEGESLEPNVNGDTVVDTNDVAELMKLVLSNKADVSKHNFNGDKVVDVLDAKQLLTDILAGKYNA